jgi:hypothetical protein
MGRGGREETGFAWLRLAAAIKTFAANVQQLEAAVLGAAGGLAKGAVRPRALRSAGSAADSSKTKRPI